VAAGLVCTSVQLANPTPRVSRSLYQNWWNFSTSGYISARKVRAAPLIAWVELTILYTSHTDHESSGGLPLQPPPMPHRST
jgi:hypothetical protein